MAITSKNDWVKQRLPTDVQFEDQTVKLAISQALTDQSGDKFAALADLWERIDAEMLYEFADLEGAFRMSGPLALKKAQYWRGLSDKDDAGGRIQFVPVRFHDVPSSSSAEFG